VLLEEILLFLVQVKVTCEPQPDRLEISVLAHVITQGETSGEIEALTGI
jgi:hypothetical protein